MEIHKWRNLDPALARLQEMSWEQQQAALHVIEVFHESICEFVPQRKDWEKLLYGKQISPNK